MKLHEALGITTGQIVAFIGAGGKTTAIWRVLHKLEGPTVFTTTTKIMEPILPGGVALMLAPRPDLACVQDTLTRTPHLVLAAGRLPGDYPSNPGHPVPSQPCKLAGLLPDILDQLIASLAALHPAVLPLCPTWLIEADGAKGCGLKIPGDHEPVIPASVTRVVVCAHLDVIGRPVSEATVHRLTQMGALGLRQGELITPGDFVRVLAGPRAGLKGAPPGARVVALLTQRDPEALHPHARLLCERLIATGRFERVVAAALRSEQPALAVKSQRPVAAVVLAAGASTRMGQLKQLLDWRGKPLVRHVVDQVCAAQLDRQAIVVVGCQVERVRAALEGSDVRIIFNADWEGGLSTSLRTGLAALPDDVEAAVFVQADQPNVTPRLLAALIARFRDSGVPIIVPAYRGQQGTPVLFAREFFGELARVSGDEGGRSLIRRHADRVVMVEVDDPDVFADVDTWQDYHELIDKKGR